MFCTKYVPKKVLKIKTKKREHPHRILHMGISLSTILAFWTKFTQKGYFQSKTD